MAKPAVKVYLDLTGTGAFATEITSVVLSAEWSLGFGQPFDLIARDNMASIVVNNANRNFTPEYASGAYYGSLVPGLAVKITTTYATVTRTMWVGWASSFAPVPGTTGVRRCVIACDGWFDKAMRRESLVPLQLGKRVEQVVEVILDQSDILPPSVTGRWILGGDTLGVGTKLGAVADYFTALDTGDTTFAYAGDWSSGTSVYGAVREMVEREGGRFWQRRDGMLILAPRLWFPVLTTTSATFADGMLDMAYRYGADVSNVITTNYEPRSVGTPASTVGVLGASAAIGLAGTLDVEFRFETQGSGGTIAATALVSLVATTDYTVNSASDGSGTNLTGNVTAAFILTNATAVTVRFTNTGAAGFVQAGSKVRGTPLTRYNSLAYTATDSDSVLAYGRRGYTSPGVQDSLADATTLGDYQLALRKDPVGRADSVLWSVWDTAITADVLAVTVGDRIALSEQQTQAAGYWFVMGEQHSTTEGFYNVTWVLEDAGTLIYWLLGVTTQSELGTTTFVGPL